MMGYIGAKAVAQFRGEAECFRAEGVDNVADTLPDEDVEHFVG